MTYKEIIETYYTELSPKSFKQMLSAKHQSDLTENIILRDCYRPDLQTHFALASSKATKRCHVRSFQIVNGMTKNTLSDYSFFTNALKLVDEDSPEISDVNGRLRLNPETIITLEFDEKEISFFELQLSWFRNSRYSKMAGFVQAMRKKYFDFLGVSVCYSGSKSFHYHFLFSAHHITDPKFPLDGLKRSWRRLEQEFKTYFNITEDSDDKLANSGQFRRIPCGTRTLEKDNMFGVPADTKIAQPVLYEELYGRAGKGSVSSFLNNSDFLTAIYKPSSSAKNLVTLTDNSSQEAYAESKLKQYFPDGEYPEFAGFGKDKDGVRAYFRNGPMDKNPQSSIGPNFRTIAFMGKDGPMLKSMCEKSLPKKLNDFLHDCYEEYDRFNSPEDQLPKPFFGRERTATEEKFALQSTDNKSAIEAISRIIRKEVTSYDKSEALLINAPEGISKTRALIAATKEAIFKLSEAELPLKIMYAFATYEQAAEKLVEFNNQYQAEPNSVQPRAVLIKSFSKQYDEISQRLNIKKIDVPAAEQLGCASVFEAIEKHQPKVLAEMEHHVRSLHAQMYDDRNRIVFRPVFFTVHDVAHNWQHSSPTRLMYSKAWWENRDVVTARETTRLGLIIHDEISPENLMTTIQEVDYLWLQFLKESEEWKEAKTVVQQHQAIKNCPIKAPNIATESLIGLLTIKDWSEPVAVSNKLEYGDPREHDIYKCDGEYRFSLKPWFSKNAFKVIALTTERVPTEIARWSKAWRVIELDTPLIPRDIVTTTATRTVVGDNLVDQVTLYREEFEKVSGEPLLVISNRVSILSDTKTHATAKGSNSFIGKSVLQTMTMMDPTQYTQYQVYNAITEKDDLVLARHLDEFNQTAGRNLGFRYRAGAEHHLLINKRLCDLLDGEHKLSARYEIDEHQNAIRRKHRITKVAINPIITAKPVEKVSPEFAAMIKQMKSQKKYA